MNVKDPSSYSVDEVCLFLNALGLAEKIDTFRGLSIDGTLLVTLEADDMGELGVSSFQGKKILNGIQFTKSLASVGGGSDSRVAELEAENAQLKRELAYYRPAPAPQQVAYAPAPASVTPPPPSNEHHVLKGAARGTARGVILGAVGGAIAGDAKKGVKIGAAVGATGGAMQGLGARRRARLIR